MLQWRHNLIVIGLLLTEVRIGGVPIRSPIISILTWLAYRPLPALLLAALAGSYITAGSVSVGLEKANELTYLIITLGAIVCASLSVEIRWSLLSLYGYLFFTLYALQIIGLFPLIDLFVLDAARYTGTTTGLSSEPSFSSWMLFILLCHSVAQHRRIPFSLILATLTAFVFGASINNLSILLVLSVTTILCSIAINGRRLPDIYIVVLVTLLPIAVDIAMRMSGLGLGHLILQELRSWRELSHFSSIYGAGLAHPPAFGEYSERIYEGQKALGGAVFYWIESPWSLFALQCLEFGLVPAVVFSLIIWRLFYVPTRSGILSGIQVTLFLCALFLAPKWAVYLLINPLKLGVLDRRDSAMRKL